MIANISCCAYINSKGKLKHNYTFSKKSIHWLRKVKPECDHNPFDLFNWLNLGSWESLLWRIFQSLAVIVLIVTTLISLVHCILSRVLNAIWQPLTLKWSPSGLNTWKTSVFWPPGLWWWYSCRSRDCITLLPDNSTIGNSEYAILSLATSTVVTESNSILIGHTLSLLRELPKGGDCKIKYKIETGFENYLSIT